MNINITQFIKNYHPFRAKNIKTLKSTKDKGKAVYNLLMDILEAGITFSIRELSKAIGVSRKLVAKVLRYIQNPLENNIQTETRGRKKYEDKYPNLVEHIKEICTNSEYVDEHMREHIVYIDITPKIIIDKLKKVYGYTEKECPCENTIIRILKEQLHYKITKVKKSKVFKKIEQTDDIMKNVNEKKKEVENSDENTVCISIDDKATLKMGDLSNNGFSWLDKNALDHDTHCEGKIKPFGIMDLKTKQVSVYCTLSNSTARYKVNCIEEYLIAKLSENPNISKMIIFLDNGPENSSSRTMWLYLIIELSKKYNIEIELVYYPPYHSKYNMIEHFWGVLQRHWGGLILDTTDKVIGAINGTTWANVPANGYLKTESYSKGEKADKKELVKMIDKHVIYKNEGIEKWSLTIIP